MSILSKIKKHLFCHRLKTYSPFIEKGNSIFVYGFSLRQVVPVKHKRLFIGDGSVIGCQCIFESDKGEIRIGDNCHVGGFTIISRSKVQIGDNVTIAWGGVIYDHDSHSLDYKERRLDTEREFKDLSNNRSFIASKDWSSVKTAPIIIEDDVWIGMNCIILKGVTIGRGAVIGAGSVVTHDIPPFTLAAGNPAKEIRKLK